MKLEKLFDRNIKYKRHTDTAIVVNKNDDGTYDVRIKGNDELIGGVSAEDANGTYSEGDFVTIGNLSGNRGIVSIQHPSAYR